MQTTIESFSKALTLAQELLPEMPKTFRTFFAVPIAEDLQEKIVTLLKPLQHSKRLRSLAIKWTAPKKMHITLRFLGNINVEQYKPIVAQAGAAQREVKAFAVRLVSLRPFPDKFSPHTLILKPQSLVELKELAIIFDKVAVANGVKEERRPFVPHLTVARFKKQRRLTDDEVASLTMDNLLELDLPVNEIILYRSVAGKGDESGSSEYVELNKFILGA